MRLKNKVALITGASQGIGAAIAVEYAKEGAHVILCARSKINLEKIDDKIFTATGKNATLVELDLRKFELINLLGDQIYERFGKLDILVANAAILGDIGPITQTNPQTFTKVMDINFTANWYLLRRMDPLLRLSNDANIIFVSSSVTKNTHSYWNAYACSKKALEELALLYAQESRYTNVKTNIVHPGRVRTDMRAQAMPGEDPLTIPAPENITGIFVDLAENKNALNAQIFDAYIKEPAHA